MTLLEELYDDASYSSYVRTDGNGNDHYRRNTDYELFAKLIIKECQQVSLKNSHRDDDMGAIIAKQIGEHFGITKGVGI